MSPDLGVTFWLNEIEIEDISADQLEVLNTGLRISAGLPLRFCVQPSN